MTREGAKRKKMAKQILFWTALPNGYTEDRNSLKVSLFLTPRLDPEQSPERLSTFPDFVDWPATIRQARFTFHFGALNVTIDGSTTAGPNHVDGRLAHADPNIWSALFPETVLVKKGEYRDLTDNKVLSFDAAKMDTIVRDLYSRLAASATDELPTASTILAIPAWNAFVDAISRLDGDDRLVDFHSGIRDTKNQFEVFRTEDFKSLPGLTRDLAFFQLFHTPASTPRIDRYAVPLDDPRADAQWQGYEQTPLPAKSEFQNQLDFHDYVGAMGQYPTMLRKLGLVIDFVIARTAFNQSPNDLLWVDVELPSGSPDVERSRDASPRTRTLLDARRFQAVTRTVPGNGDYKTVDRLLDFSPSQFRILQADVDGSVMKVSNFARTLGKLKNVPDEKIDPVTKQERTMGAPSLRNAGLMLVHTNRGVMLKDSIDRQDKFNQIADSIRKGVNPPPKPPELEAEDIIRGWRIDIWDDKSGKWHSLCRRSAIYDINNGQEKVEIEEEEGTITLAATKSADKKSNDDIIWLHEALVSWTGWSLCARPPGKSIHHNHKTHLDPVGEPEPELPPGLRLKTAFNAFPGSLPRLRYGRKYWLRARATDIAGNSLPVSEKDFGAERRPTNVPPYSRFEPILAPSLALVKPKAARLEIPLEGESMERIAVRSFNETPADNLIPSAQEARRIVVPTRTSARDAEHHGKFDENGIVDSSSFAMLAAQDNSLKSAIIQTAGPLAEAPPVDVEYAVMEEGTSLPYLPEPLAVVVAARIFDHPGISSSKIIPISFYPGNAQWPAADSFRILLQEKPGDVPHFEGETRTLVIPLAKADRATLRLSIMPSKTMIEMLGVWNWLSQTQKTNLEKLALTGQHWMLTPWRTIDLVHAVQKPLIAPEVKSHSIGRFFNATHALPTFLATCSIKSTSQIDVLAAWNEPVDDPALGGKNRDRRDHAFAVKTISGREYAGKPEYQLEKPDQIRFGGSFGERVVRKVHEFNDTRYRRIEYTLEATSCFREFMPRDVLTEEIAGVREATDKNIKVAGPTLRTWIPSSAPPAAPDVLYVVPTFGWVRSQTGGRRSSWRRGGGLRVYLNRPWNVSGYGEMLAVVLPSANFTGDPTENPAAQPIKNYVTQWGNDPIWKTPYVPGISPKRSNFPLARMAPDGTGKWLPKFAPATEADQRPGNFKVTELLHPELTTEAKPQGLVEAAPHDVFFDEERQLWYSDIEITWGASYFPYIRLALSRYQPDSLEGAHLSNVVLADFMALAPDRWLNVTQSTRPGSFRVTLYGNSYTDSSSHHEADEAQPVSLAPPFGPPIDVIPVTISESTVVDVWVERLDTTLGEDFGWKRDPDAKVALSRPLTPRVGSLRQQTLANRLFRERAFESIIQQGLLDLVLITPTLWNGSVGLPENAPRETRFRVAIAEYEEHITDGSNPYFKVPTDKGRRLVFIEYVEIS